MASLRVRFIAAWLVVVVVACGAMTVIDTRVNRSEFIGEFRDRVQAVADIGRRTLDVAALDRLAAQLSPNLSPADVARIEGSSEYTRVWGQLNDLRNTDSDLIHFIYVLRMHEGVPRFLVDVDVLSSNRPAPQDTSDFNTVYPDVENVPALRAALANCTEQVERDFVRDEPYHVRSLSAYYPIPAPDGRHCLGILGVDMLDTNADAMIHRANHGAWLACAIVALVLGAIGSVVVIRLLRPWERVRRELGHLAEPYRNSVIHRSDAGQLDGDLQIIKQLCSTPTDSIAKRMQDQVAVAYGGPPSAQRFELDLVPDTGIEDDPARVDRIAVHEQALALVATVTGLGHGSELKTSDALGVWRELFGQFGELAAKRNFVHAKTTSGSIMVLALGAPPTAELVRSMVDLAIELAATTKRTASAAKMPLSLASGLALGRLVTRTTPDGKLVDTWGSSLVDAGRLRQGRADSRIHITERVRGLASGIPYRATTLSDGGEPTYVIETRVSQQLI